MGLTRQPSDAASKPASLFIRDDDVGELTNSLRGFLAAFLKRDIPVSYQIIPERLTAECASFLLGQSANHPGLIEFGQHGLRHEMMVRGRREFYEFGPERSYDEQRADIRAGKDILRDRLGARSAATVFTPPRHRYDRNTLNALKAEGFSVLSSSAYTDLPHRAAYAVGRALSLTNLGRGGVARHGRVRPDCGLLELSIAIGADDGSKITRSVDSILASVERARRHTGVIGIMFHHRLYGSAAGQSFLETLVDRLAAMSDVKFQGVGALAASLNP